MSSTYFTDSVSDLCQGIIDKVDTYEKRIKYLEEENKKLKDEHYNGSRTKKNERGSVQRISNFRKRTRENQRVGIKT